jgi:hypothetical protein
MVDGHAPPPGFEPAERRRAHVRQLCELIERQATGFAERPDAAPAASASLILEAGRRRRVLMATCLALMAVVGTQLPPSRKGALVGQHAAMLVSGESAFNRDSRCATHAGGARAALASDTEREWH